MHRGDPNEIAVEEEREKVKRKEQLEEEILKHVKERTRR